MLRVVKQANKETNKRSCTVARILVQRNKALLPNGQRYPLGVGVGIRRRNGKNSKLNKCPKNAAHTPSRVHALLGNPTA
jgi:hypothetical protein